MAKKKKASKPKKKKVSNKARKTKKGKKPQAVHLVVGFDVTDPVAVLKNQVQQRQERYGS